MIHKKGKNNKKQSKGITLIALVITIIVLLILAGVGINAIMGNENVMEKAKEAKVKDEEANEFDSIKLAVVNAMADGNNGKVSGKNLRLQLEGLVTSTETIGDDSTGPWTVQGKTTRKEYTIDVNGNVKEGEDSKKGTELNPKVGDKVFYSPNGKYSWNGELAGSGENYHSWEVKELKSSEGEDYHIENWKILNYDSESKLVQIVPESPVGILEMSGCQGYNNAVLLLNEACKGLYADEKNGITARSISEVDFENAAGEAWKTAKESYKEYNFQTKYGSQFNQLTYKYARCYPLIYAQEKKSVIDDEEIPEGQGLGNSEQQVFINEPTRLSTSYKIY